MIETYVGLFNLFMPPLQVRRTLDDVGDVHVLLEVTSSYQADVLALIDNITFWHESCAGIGKIVLIAFIMNLVMALKY